MQLLTLGKKARQEVSDLEMALRRKVRGEVRFDAGSRALYATDASNFRQVPVAVVVPWDREDVIETVAVCRAQDTPILSRGGGTSLAGQCCNVAVVMDMSKCMRAVVEIDPEGRRARVEPGVVLDDLRRHAYEYMLTYGPDPSTHDRCTLGGMIGNNSCGVHSVQSEFYGPGPRTEDNVHELEILTYDGEIMRVGPTPPEELRRIVAGGGRRAEIYRGLEQLVERYAPLIRERFPAIPRRVSGYNLPALLPENGFDVARALVGTESTCVTYLEATVALIRHFPERALLVLGYDTIFAAGDHIPAIRELRPVGLEGFDKTLMDYLKKERSDQSDHLELLPEGEGWLLVEFGADSHEEAVQSAHEAADRLRRQSRAPRIRVLDDPEQQEKLWQLRKSGLGVTAFVPGEHSTWPGWEDSAVPPDRVGEYLRALHRLMDRHGVRAALYGHFGQGCIHARFTFELTTEEGIAQYRRFTREAAETCLEFGGSLSGEHGDGQQRGDLLELMYGPELMQAFREFKALWDPRGRMNPGKVIDAAPRTADLRLGTEPRWDPAVRFAYEEDGGSFAHAAMRCVGVGECRRTDGGVMCPSYMVTLEEKHTTRGRAHLLFEMTKRDVIDDGWRSHEVKEALDLCLSCKGCKSDCPVHVDMATYKAEFLYHYYKRRLRPRQAYAMGLIQFWARIASWLPRLTNFVSHAPVLSRIVKAIGGIAQEREMPRFATHSFRATFRSRHDGNGGSRPRVLLWPDTFNNYFYPDILHAAADVLEDAGCRVSIPRKILCCGRPLYDYGMLDLARATWRQTIDHLATEIDERVPIVGIEPSCVAAFRDELPALMHDHPLAKLLSSQVFTLAEFLIEHADGYQPPTCEGRALVHTHCHHHAIMGADAEHELLEQMGLEATFLDSGCCGMAGAFGFEHDKYVISVAAGERKLLPAVRAASPDTIVIADGFSCREQVRQLSGRRALHTAEVLRDALASSTSERRGERRRRESVLESGEDAHARV